MEVEVGPNQPGTTTFSLASTLIRSVSKVGHIWKMMDVRVSQTSGWKEKKTPGELKSPGSPRLLKS